jgi:hypothetical protein
MAQTVSIPTPAQMVESIDRAIVILETAPNSIVMWAALSRLRIARAQIVAATCPDCGSVDCNHGVARDRAMCRLPY